ncbi:MAG: hypothetical protein E7620_08830, partial [Ruminococcaceae bacterium]|nr:hypothetical protein [Oscillospiraceae bacterium]
MKRTLIWVLTLAMLLGCLPVVAAASEIPAEASTYERDGVTYTVIRTGEEFIQKLTAPGNYILGADVDFGGKSFSSAVTLTKGTYVIDGNGFTVKGYSLAGDGDVSLFGVSTGGDITIRNFTFGTSDAPISISTTGTGKSVGGLFGYANATFLLENVTGYVDIKTTQCYSGGLLGNVRGKGTVTDCKVYGRIDNGSTTGARGGIIGQISANLEATFSNCVNYATIADGGYNIGGIAGRLLAGKKVIIRDCANYGLLKCLKYAGGIIGQIQPDSVFVDYTIEGCVNYGKILGGTQSGGLFGDVSFNKGVTGGSMLVENCVNYGAVKGEADMSGLAGRINSRYPVTFHNCANYGDVTGTANTAGLSSSVALGENTLTVDGFLNLGTIDSPARASGGVTGWLSDASSYVFKNCVNLGAIFGTVAGNLFSSIPTNATVSDCCAFSTQLTASNANAVNGYVIANPPANESGEPANMRYIAVEGSNWHTSLADTPMTVAEAVAYLNETYGAVWGGFVMNTANSGIVPAAPKLAGVQETAVSEGKQSIRFVGLLQDSLQYSRVGFELTIGEVSLGE